MRPVIGTAILGLQVCGMIVAAGQHDPFAFFAWWIGGSVIGGIISALIDGARRPHQ